jgi:alkylated DNA repair dioxygenase AlkB
VTDCFSYLPDFLAADEADRWLRLIDESLCWQSETLTMYGRQIPVPREVAWCGERGLNYRYSGLDHRASGWLPEILELKDRVERACGTQFNFVLANRYRDGRDYMGWHRDNEPGMVGLVASLSLGDRRRFLMRLSDKNRSQRLQLDHGSLLIFDGAIRHCLPRCAVAGPRLNLTFRSLVGKGHS